MAAISAKMVMDLRGKTDLPMMECKHALNECNGNIDEAMEWLRKKHKGKMSERADRATGEGRISVYIDDARKVGAIIELQCETAPVAKNELFVELAAAIARTVAAGPEASPDGETIRQNPEVDSKFTDVFGRLRETMNLRSCRKIEGEFLCSYVHHDSKSGVVLALNATPKSDKNVGADLCMHTLFTKPLAIDRSGVPAEKVNKVRNDAIEAAKAEGKPEQIVEKIAQGKVNAYYAEQVLMEQLHVKTDDYGKAKIADVLKQAGVTAITEMALLVVGG
jgi:elongation factor Ts